MSQLNSKLNNLAVSSGSGVDMPLISSLSAGHEIADIYLTSTTDEISDDSEGEEVPRFNVNGKYLF